MAKFRHSTDKNADIFLPSLGRHVRFNDGALDTDDEATIAALRDLGNARITEDEDENRVVVVVDDEGRPVDPPVLTMTPEIVPGGKLPEGTDPVVVAPPEARDIHRAIAPPEALSDPTEPEAKSEKPAARKPASKDKK